MPIKKKFILSLQWERFFPLLPTPVRSVHPAAPGWALSLLVCAWPQCQRGLQVMLQHQS